MRGLGVRLLDPRRFIVVSPLGVRRFRFLALPLRPALLLLFTLRLSAFTGMFPTETVGPIASGSVMLSSHIDLSTEALAADISTNVMSSWSAVCIPSGRNESCSI